jgi:hypothetical protein
LKTETKVYITAYFSSVPFIGKEIKLSGKWKTIVVNDDYHLLFEDTKGDWYPDDRLNIITTTEYINECTNAGC